MPFDLAALVNQQVPSDAPRRVHIHVESLRFSARNSVNARNLHGLSSLNTRLAPFSRARWLDAELLFVPTADAADYGFFLTGAFVATDASVAVPADLRAHANCEHRVSLVRGSIPEMQSIRCDFGELALSPLVKPPPLEMLRAKYAYYFDFAKGPQAAEGDDILYQVYLVGHVEGAGMH